MQCTAIRRRRYEMVTLKKNWEGAMNYCNSTYHSKLLIIASFQELLAVIAHVEANRNSKYTYVSVTQFYHVSK